MKYLSLFSGIEAATVAWKPLGWQPVAFAEIEPFPCALLAHHYPDVPNLGSVTEITSEQIAALGHIDLVVGGSPCQDLSIAGKRAGFSGERSSLFYEQMRIFHAARSFCGARWLVWENVPGAFSSQHGRDFAEVVGEMAGCKPLVPEKGWGREGVAVGSNGLLEWAVLDAQWFGVAQRRRRVFAVLDTGDWQRRPPVLFESESLRRDHPPSREAGQEFTKSLAGGAGQRLDSEGLATTTYSIHPHCIGRSPNAGPQGKEFLDDGSAYCLDSRGQAQAIAFGVGGNGDLGHCLRSEASRADKADSTTYVVQAYSFDSLSSNSMKSKNPNSGCRSVDVAKTLDTSDQNPSKNQGGMAVVVSLRGREGGATAELGDEVGNCLRASGEGGDKAHVLAPVVDTLYNKGIVTLKEGNASTQETYPGTLLRALRQEIGAEAFAKWGLGILDSLQQAEVLRQALHGLSIRPASFSRSWVVCCALGFPVYGSGWLLQSLREAGCERCSSQGWEPSEQLAGQLGAYLSELSRPGAQAARFMRDLWFASEGVGLLQQALLAVQEVGRPAGRQGEPVFRNTEGVGAEAGENLLSSGVQREISCERVLQQACPTSEARDDRGTSEDEIGSGFVQMASGMMVRRLTVEECEFLQGFPRGYSKIPYRKKPADQCPDSPRYKALGNSMAVPVMRWIGERIENAATVE